MRPALATDFQVESETEGQGYQVRRYGEGGSVMLDRRRLIQAVRLNAFNLLPPATTGPNRDRNHIYFTSFMRFETDFGSYLTDAPVGTDRISEVPRARSLDQFDLLYATVNGEDVFGFLDFQLGRQVVFDLMDFYAFDGIDVKVKLPWWTAIEAFTGLEVRGESPIASPIYELDGTSAGSRDPAGCLSLALGPAGANRPCPNQNAALAPMVGFAAESWGLPWLHARVAYRRTGSDTAGRVQGDGLPESGVNEEKLAMTANFALGPVQPYGGARYNLMVGRWDQLEAGARLRLRGHSVVGQYLRNVPTFDGDSIFNVFAIYPFNDVRMTYTPPEWGMFRPYLAGFGRFFGDELNDLRSSATIPIVPATDPRSAGFTLGTKIKLSRRGGLRVEGYYEDGFGGRRTGGELSGRYLFIRDTVELEGRMTLVNFKPDNQEHNGQGATSFGLQTGVRYAFAEQMSLHLLFEDNHNRYYPYQLRAIALLDLRFWR